MSFTLIYPEPYIKTAKKFLKKHPDLLGQYQKTLQLLELNPKHPSLRLHRLKGKLQGLYSVSMNMQYRITLELLIEDEKITLMNVGSHDAVY